LDARLTKTGILEQGIRQLRIARPRPTGAEEFNSRLKFYDCLGGLFRHGADKHKYAFEAICVTLQYAMDLGEPIFDVVHHDGMLQQQHQQQQHSNSRTRANAKSSDRS
jgi:hypothetical protein